ncbi:helix-turn-helix domain-containing protein [Streptomyces sp. NPDC050516]|uniref:helix-turn-helix domain-containing protein n=1 Tax=Streptomyces sp. NPDC050516 TaxID=3365621 RepID=UPI0037A31677
MTTDESSLAAFLRSRRERLKPEQVGLASHGRRRTPGLRRGEPATLAGLSVEYLERLEQGRDTNPSGAVLTALADALHLSVEEKLIRYHFLHPVAHQILDEASWAERADEAVGWLRAAEPDWGSDRAFQNLVDDVRAVPEFPARWAAHTVAARRPISNRVRHPEAGHLSMRVEVLFVGDANHRLQRDVIAPVEGDLATGPRSSQLPIHQPLLAMLWTRTTLPDGLAWFPAVVGQFASTAAGSSHHRAPGTSSRGCPGWRRRTAGRSARW